MRCDNSMPPGGGKSNRGESLLEIEVKRQNRSKSDG
jgi:hypothetical protein